MIYRGNDHMFDSLNGRLYDEFIIQYDKCDLY
jgi:hypothetical protein